MDKDEMNEAIKRAEDAVHLNGARAYYLPEDINLLIAAAKALTAQDVNEELFEALNIATNELEEHSKCEDCQVGVPLNILNKCHGAIARAEQKGQ